MDHPYHVILNFEEFIQFGPSGETEDGKASKKPILPGFIWPSHILRYDEV